MLGSSRYMLLVSIGGFFWWVFVKLCKTELSNEMSEKKKERNILFFCFFIVVVSALNIFFTE